MRFGDMTDFEQQIKSLTKPFVEQTGGVLSALRAIQNELRCIPLEADAVVADVFNLSKAEVAGVVSFYSDFSREPDNSIVVRICAAEACQAMGARRLQAEIGTQISSPGDVTVKPVYCLGLCSTAPSAMVGEKLIARASADRVLSEVASQKGGE